MKKSFTLGELARLTQASLVGDQDAVVFGVDELETASEGDATFLSNEKYSKLLARTKATVVCIAKKDALKPHLNYLISDNPSQTFQIILELFYPPIQEGFEGIHPSAVIHPSAKIDPTAKIGPHVVIDQKVVIGKNTSIGAGCTLGPLVQIGSDCILHAGCHLREKVTLHDRIILQPGVIVGSCGYGYITDETTGTHQKIQHRGSVIIENDVEIGANTTIDAGRFKPTRVKRGAKIDNLCMIGHNVEIGENVLVVAQVGIAGSTKVGQNSILAGQVGVAGHLQLDPGVIVTAQSGVSKSLKKGIYRGTPAIPLAEFQKIYLAQRKLSLLPKKGEKTEKV